MDRMASKCSIVTYWENGTPASVAAQRMRDFYAKIYWAWVSIVHKAIDEPNAQDLDTLHRCDFAIHQSGARPERVSLSIELAQLAKQRVMDKGRRAMSSGADYAAGQS